ncbi:MAG: hypothetical protein MJ070_01855 [Lachnospiraceae bacterium]|nr:hypothetical protein [Lachnospiraceae bacterium]
MCSKVKKPGKNRIRECAVMRLLPIPQAQLLNPIISAMGMKVNTKKYKNLPKLKNSDREKAPTFYSAMSRTIDAIKQDKIGASSVVPYLKGKGVLRSAELYRGALYNQ